MFRNLKNWLFHNTRPAQTIAKNTFWLLSGQMTSRLLRAAIVIYAARLLGAAHWGAFSYGLGVVTFLTVFSDIGINALITKESTRNPELKNRYLATAFFIKLGLLIVLVVATTIFLRTLTHIEEASLIMPILIFVFVFDTLRDLGSALSRSLEKMEIEAATTIFTNLVIVVLGFIFLAILPTTRSLALAYALGSGIGLLATIYILRGYFQNLFSNFTVALIKPILVNAWPFGLMGLMGVVNLNTDVIMLGWMRTATEIGYYSTAQKLIQLLYVLPTLLATSIFPAMARLVKTEPEKAKSLLEKSIALMLLISLPLILIGFFFAHQIVLLFFGAEYLPSVLTFQILLLTLLTVYPLVVIGNAIFAYDQQRSFIVFVAVAIFSNVFFNALFIPAYGIEGAAISTVVAQLITNLLIWKKIKSINRLSVWPHLKRYLTFRQGA